MNLPTPKIEQLAMRDGVTLRSFLEELRAAGLELVAEAPFDALLDPRRAIEEVNIAGLALGRLTVHQLPSPDALPLFRQVAALQHAVGVIRAFAPLPRHVNPAVPTTGYDTLAIQKLVPGAVLVASVVDPTCIYSLAGQTIAAKLTVDSVNTTTRKIYLRKVVDPNCGYLSVMPDSIPTF